MVKLIARAFSDLHIHDYAQFNKDDKRIKYKFQIIREILEGEVPLLFSGDFFHEDQHISNKVFDYCSKELPEIFSGNNKLIGISGNHEMNETNQLGQMSPSLFRSICNFVPNMYCIDFRQLWLNKDTVVFGLPYINYNVKIEESLEIFYLLPEYREAKNKILLIHTDLHGARDTDGRKIGSVENISLDMDKFFGFDLVLSGHIHKPQRITKKVIMLGAPDQQRKSDMGGKFGYWDIYSDMSYKFRKLKYPEFKTYDPAKDEIDDYHYWIPINSEKEDDLLYEERKFTNNTSRKLLAKRYCKEKGIKDKNKIKALKEVLND